MTAVTASEETENKNVCEYERFGLKWKAGIQLYVQ